MNRTYKQENSADSSLQRAIALLRSLGQPVTSGRIGTDHVIPAEVLQVMLAREWVYAWPDRPGVYRLSDIGRSFLRRMAAGEEPFREQHQVIRRRAERTAVTCNEAETPLGWLLNRLGRDGKTLISRDQFDAGERLRVDFTLAQMTPRVTAVWGEPLGGAGRGAPSNLAAMTDAVIAAKARYFAALECAGPGLADVLVQTCCHLQGLEEAEKHLGWPARSSKVVLRIALDRLVVHYGLISGVKPRSSAPGKINLRNTQNKSC